MDTYIYLYVVLRIEPSAPHMLSKHSTTELQTQPLYAFFFFNKNVYSPLPIFIYLFLCGAEDQTQCLTRAGKCSTTEPQSQTPLVHF